MLSKKFIECSATIVMGLMLTQIAAADDLPAPSLVTSPVNKVYVPLGFDDNDVSEVILRGHFPDTCYKVGPASAVVNEATKIIEITASAYHYAGGCAQVLVPFIQTVKVGVVKSGSYTIKVIDRPDATTTDLNVVEANTSSPDDFLYAPVENVAVTPRLQGGWDLAIDGHYPFMFIGCMVIRDVRVTRTPGNVLVVLPIAELSEDDVDCAPQADSKAFAIKKELTGVEEGEFLAHVRVLAGSSVNRIVMLEQ
jgi:hypothetical protein